MKNLYLPLLALLLVGQARAADDLFATLDNTLPVIDSSAEADVTPLSEQVDKGSLLAGDENLKILDFYRRRIPNPLREVPSPSDGEHLFWKLGDIMRDVNLPPGTYSIIRTRDRNDGFFIRYLGRLDSNGRNSVVTETFAEIKPGDFIVKEAFNITLPPLTGDHGFINIRPRSLGKVSALIEPEQDEELFFSGTRSFIAAKFYNNSGGNSASLGANFVVKRKGVPIAKVVVVDADLDLGTLYVYDSDREVRAGDEIFMQ